MKKIILLISILTLILTGCTFKTDIQDKQNDNEIIQSGEVVNENENIVTNNEENVEISIDKTKTEWLTIKDGEEIEVLLNGGMKKINCEIYNLNISAETGACEGLVEFTDVENEKYVSTDFSKYAADFDTDSFSFNTDASQTISNIEFEVGKIIDVITNKEYLVFAIGHLGEDVLLICNDKMEFCTKYTRPYAEHFAETAIFEEGAKVEYPIDEKYKVPVEECFNTEIIYYDLYGMEKEYLDNISYTFEAYDKDEDELKMAKRKVTIENGIIKDEVVEYYTNFISGQM